MKGKKAVCDYNQYTKDPYNIPQCTEHDKHSCAGCFVGIAARWNPFRLDIDTFPFFWMQLEGLCTYCGKKPFVDNGCPMLLCKECGEECEDSTSEQEGGGDWDICDGGDCPFNPRDWEAEARMLEGCLSI